MHALANPTRFTRLSSRLLPWIAGATALLLAAGLYAALLASPADYQQGETVRIMYLHVPAAWMALGIYLIMGISSAFYLIYKHPLADVIAEASAPIGAIFTALTLLTGMLWGKPMWGAWWVWDARLTSVLVLFFLYLGYLALADALHAEQGRKALALLALIGLVNLPIIKFSVDWWNTLHQPASVLRAGGPSIHPSMQWPLWLMFSGFYGLYACLLILRAQTLLWRRKLSRRCT